MRLIPIVLGVEAGVEFLQGAADRIEHAAPAMEGIRAVMQRQADLNFVEQGAAFGGWVELSLATLDRRRNEDKSSVQILRDTGYLMQSLSPGSGNQFTIADTTDTTAVLGTNRPGAIAHQEGNEHVPQRQFLGHTEQNIADYEDIYRDFVLGIGMVENV